jgi:hypothetical protein
VRRLWGTPDWQPRRTWRQAVWAARRTGLRFDSLREALLELAGHNRYAAAFAIFVVALMAIGLVGVVALAGLVTVSVASSDRALQVAVFVVVTLGMSGLLALTGQRPWIYVVEVLLWKRESPPDWIATTVHVHADDRDRATAVLTDAGYRYVAADPAFRPPRGAGFPTVCIKAWARRDPAVDEEEPPPGVYDAVKVAGIRVSGIVGAFTRDY